MSNSIYDVENWGFKFNYKKNDIVRYPERTYDYYYALKDHTRESADFSLSPFSYDSTKWSNAKELIGSDYYPKFIWTPSYNTEIENEPNINSVMFDDGVEHNTPDGINRNLIVVNANFSNRDLNETTAILHFLKQRNGSEGFIYTPYKPNQERKFFVCPEWSCSSNFNDNFTISARFEEMMPYPEQLTLS